MELILVAWNEVLLRPMLNGLLLFYGLLFNSFGLSIVLLTVVVRLITLPLTMKQLKATKAISVIQPKLQELQKKYGKDRQKISQETMRLYKEHGISPMGCVLPMVIQFPVWIGLYQVIIMALNLTPEGLLGLSRALYSWLGVAHEAIPLNAQLLWLNLARPDPTPVLPVLTGASMWVMQKQTTPVSADPAQAATNRMMQWMFPLMFAFLTFSFPSGLALYWVISNIVGIVIQYFITGWGGLRPAPAPKAQRGEEADGKARAGKPRDKR
ncbi:MAG: membrane protein insertase YidC [Chloroflexi bacterium]|nr:membrane protein insertase YidC [Chloroflexota bacterium]